MQSTVCHFEIPAEDLAAAKEFYSKLFGWEVVEAFSQEAPEYMLVRTSEQQGALGGALFKRGEDGRGVTLYVMVESVDDAAAKLEELGGAVLVPKAPVPGMGWTVLARDPQGNPIGLFQEDKEAS
jgi:predicted enzyme related to lactoylglutathione lyase